MGSDDIKIEDLVRLLDKALTSDKDNIKQALRELLVVVALTETSSKKKGPLESMLTDVEHLKIELERLRREVMSSRYNEQHRRDTYRDQNEWIREKYGYNKNDPMWIDTTGTTPYKKFGDIY